MEDVDLAVVAYDDDGTWHVQDLPDGCLDSAESIARELRRYAGERGAIGMLTVDEEFLVIIRAQGTDVRALISDVTVADEWELAASVLDHLGLGIPGDEVDPEPGGDLGIMADLGVSAQKMGVILDDEELYPDEALSVVAHRAGFGELFDDHVGLVDE